MFLGDTSMNRVKKKGRSAVKRQERFTECFYEI